MLSMKIKLRCSVAGRQLRSSLVGQHQLATSKAVRHTTRFLKRLTLRAVQTEDVALSDEQIQKFQTDGFLVIDNFASEEEVQALRRRMSELLDAFNPGPETISVFSTRRQTALADRYFFDSGNSVSFFFEENAFHEQGPLKGHLKQAKELSINKVGHALHDLDPVFRAFSRSEKVKQVLRALGYERPLPVQSMYIFKQPYIGGEVMPHQDSTFLHTEPLSTVGLWWALEDASRSNGCLWGLPGAHKQGIARRMSVQDGNLVFDHPRKEWDLSKFVPLEVKAGALVLLHGSNVHYSAENASPISRHSYSMHCVEGGTVWAEDNWLQRKPDFPFEPLY